MEIKSGLSHCCHHDRHWEFCYNYNEPVECIKLQKPMNEQSLRLRLFRLVPNDKLPGRDSAEWLCYYKAWTAYHKAWGTYNKEEAACDKAWTAYLAKYKTELEVLHSELFPDCPWDEKRKTIFTRKDKDGIWY